MTIRIRRCNGNRNAWAAVIGPSDWPITTALSLGALVERLRVSHPSYEILITPEKDA